MRFQVFFFEVGAFVPLTDALSSVEVAVVIASVALLDATILEVVGSVAVEVVAFVDPCVEVASVLHAVDERDNDAAAVFVAVMGAFVELTDVISSVEVALVTPPVELLDAPVLVVVGAVEIGAVAVVDP